MTLEGTDKLQETSLARSGSASPSKVTPWYQPTLRKTAIFILPLLSILGAYGTWTLAGANGTFDYIFSLTTNEKSLFPGSEDPLVTNFTGIGAVDRQLAILVTFFSPVVDGSHAGLTLYSIAGFGQFGAIWTLMMMEAMRRGNEGKLVSFVGTVGFIIQNISYTVTAPLWLLLHVLTSPVAKPSAGSQESSALIVSTLDLQLLPISITLGYIVPSLLMTLPFPTWVPTQAHQYLIAIWQAFPVWTVLIQYNLRRFCNAILNAAPGPKEEPTHPPGVEYLDNAKNIYRFVLGLCMLTHLQVLLVTIVPGWAFPASEPLLHKLGQETFASVFIPYFPVLTHKVQSLAVGTLTFLQWDFTVGSLAFIIWAVLLYRNVLVERLVVNQGKKSPTKRDQMLAGLVKQALSWQDLGTKTFGWLMVAGPVGVVAILLWERDTVVKFDKVKGRA